MECERKLIILECFLDVIYIVIYIMIFYNLLKFVMCIEFFLLRSFEFCSFFVLYLFELDIRASCLRVFNYFFK